MSDICFFKGRKIMTDIGFAFCLILAMIALLFVGFMFGDLNVKWSVQEDIEKYSVYYSYDKSIKCELAK